MLQSISRRAAALVLAAALALTFTLVAGSPTEAATTVVTQGIAGTATFSGDGGSTGSVAVRVEPVDPTAPHYEALTGSEEDGSFAFSLPVGEYWVQFSRHTAGSHWAPEWWGDAPTRGASTKVVVTAGEVTALDPVLEPGGTISGTFAQGAYVPGRLGFAVALAADPTFPGGWAPVGRGYTDENGNYETSSLPPGQYRVQFVESAQRIEGWWLDGGTTPATVTVERSLTSDDIDATATGPWGKITGRVRNALDNSPIAGASVNVPTIYENGSWNTTGWGSTTAGADGTFEIPMPQGGYRLYAGAPLFKTATWHGTGNVYTGEDVPVTSGQTTALFTVALSPNAVAGDQVTVAGTFRTGSTITSTAGDWRPSGITLTRQWLRDDVPIAGAKGSMYTLTAADVGHRIRVRLTGSIPYDGTTISTSTTSGATIVYPGIFRQTLSATLSGLASVGSTMRIRPPRTAPTAERTSYRWLRGGKPIPGATRATYRLVKADRGKRISVSVTITRAGFHPFVRVLTRTNRVY